MYCLSRRTLIVSSAGASLETLVPGWGQAGQHLRAVLGQGIHGVYHCRLLGLQRDRRIAPTEADVRMMAFSLRS